MNYDLMKRFGNLAKGIIRLYVNYDKKHRFKVILSNIEEEKKLENNLYQ